jgi:hypothetical protein
VRAKAIRIAMPSSDTSINARGSALPKTVISVDTKKKELVGKFRNQSREWRAQGQPEELKVHDTNSAARRVRANIQFEV